VLSSLESEKISKIEKISKREEILDIEETSDITREGMNGLELGSTVSLK
jgi:hypothetical protein